MVKKIAAAIILVLALAFIPKEIWLQQQRKEYRDITATIPDCRTIPCMDQLNKRLAALEQKTEHPPWYVWGDISWGDISMR